MAATAIVGRAQETEPYRRFLERYLERGFGVLPKKEVDRLTFTLLVDLGQIANPDDHFAVSRQLKITPIRAANLAYEYKLHSKDRLSPSELCEQFVRLLQKTNLGKASNKVALEVRDRILREEIEEKILNLRLVAPDYSFNRNLLMIDYATLYELVTEFAGQETMKKLDTALKKQKSLPKGLPTRQELFAEFLKHAAGRVGDKVIDLGVIVLTGGMMLPAVF